MQALKDAGFHRALFGKCMEFSVGDQGTIRSKMAEFAPLLRYFRSAYALYASFKCLAGTQISSFLTLQPQSSEIRLFSRQTMEAYRTYAD